MKYKYEIIAKDLMMDRPMMSVRESDEPMTRQELIDEYMLVGPDIEWFRLYDVTDGNEKRM